MFFSILVMPMILNAVDIFKMSIAIHFSVFPLSIVFSAVFPHVVTETVEPRVDPIAFIN